MIYVWATQSAGVHKEGPLQGQAFPKGQLVTAGGRVLVCTTRAEAEALMPEGCEIVELPRLPPRWASALQWREKVKKILVGGGRVIVQ